MLCGTTEYLRFQPAVNSVPKALNISETSPYYPFHCNRQPVTIVADLSDGAALALVYAEHFRQPSRSSMQLSDNWVLWFSALNVSNSG
ncbi:hypothetical protein BDR03DRAFT_1096236 [Suillus americanus]|nr:hypothetical protein BDR03DRAFT_1096236 [Suillus americanus]